MVNGVDSIPQVNTTGAGMVRNASGTAVQEGTGIWEKAGGIGSTVIKYGMGFGVYQVIKTVTTSEQREKALQKTEELGPIGFLKIGLGLGVYSAIKGGEIVDKAIDGSFSKEDK